ncbi:uncharacterized protein LOC123529056 [Mercenaria mercenaria]|uniref:uncharacterized protein LOC123529056 n=1 Tax=Mercenaria mercenaria TaxID=6596 RepID=UPI00234F3834|nr:uncharacterized protein LOC123529056 [Mercenaria mercenaria]
MFEIPDDDENFWNDVPLEDNFLSKPGPLTGKENRPQLRVPDTACTGNPAKRLCTDFNRDGALPVQAEVNKSQPWLRGIDSINNNRSSTVGNTGTPVQAEVKKSQPRLRSISSIKNSSSTVGHTGTQNVPTQQSNRSSVYQEAPVHIPFPMQAPCSNIESSIQPEYRGSMTYVNTDKNKGACSHPTGNGADIRNINSPGSKSDKKVPERISCPVSENGIQSNKESSIHPTCLQKEPSSTDGGGKRRSRSSESEAGDHVTPKRKRKFPGPAGILPKLGPGRNLDTMSPATLNTSTPVSDKSPPDDSVILCSQQTDDIFNEPAWQSLLTDMGEDGQKLLKKFSISSTVLKAGKKQLMQGKAALIFGVIDSIESHGSEASVTIRDRSGRMQGTIHRDLLKDHESDLQIGTVLVLKQVSIISLSNRNHYLNITPNNVVVLYRGGQSSLRSLKFRGSEDSLQSVLSALEKKAAAQQSNLNNSLSMTPSSLTGSARHSLTGSGTGTPQLFGASPLTGLGTSTQRYGASLGTPVPNQRLFSPQTPVTGNSPSIQGSAPTVVRDVSVVERNNTETYTRQNTLTPNFNNTRFQQRMSTPIGSTNHRSENAVSDSTFFSTPNTNFKVVPVQNNTNLSHLNTKGNLSLTNQNRGINTAENDTRYDTGSSGNAVTSVSVANFQQHNVSTNPVLNTPSTGGKSKWKFKSPPSRSGSLPVSPDLSAIPGNSVNNGVGSINGIKPSAQTNTVSSGNMNRKGTFQFSPGNIANSKSSGPVGKSCQLNGSQKTENSSRVNSSLNSGTSSAWSFKSSRIVPTVSKMESLCGQTDKSVTHFSEDNLWEDDLTDDLLSQLSEDLSS